VLGSLGSSGHWHWAAYGKHQAAGDYFRVGGDLPLLNAFAGWVRQGYQTVAAKGVPATGYHSWRFWARGSTRGLLVSGLVRDSSDSHGRPFPLLIVGSGPLLGWEEYWDLVPFACEGGWNQMERLGTKGFETVRELEAEIRKIRSPAAEWSAFTAERNGLGDRLASAARAARGSLLEELKTRAAQLARETEVHVSLDEGAAPDQFTLASLWHSLIRETGGQVPHVVFMGGSPAGSFLLLFRRALMPTDFVRLWSGPGREGDKKW
jgi:type VI secretion system protein VasJ